MYDGIGGMSVLTNWRQQDGGIGVQPRWTNAQVHALFSFRHHPVSLEHELDVAFSERISTERTLGNRHYVAEQLGAKLENFVFVRQVHGTHVAVVGEADRGLGALQLDPERPAADALVTNARQVALAILTADCVPILFYDPVRQVIAAAHSGWRGTATHISTEVVCTMQKHFATRPEDIQVTLGPSIRQCCYEVDAKVQAPVAEAFDTTVIVPRFQRPGHYWFNMQAAIREDLMRAGVQAESIEDTGICTSCRVEHLFSHRCEHGQTGRQMAAIVLT